MGVDAKQASPARTPARTFATLFPWREVVLPWLVSRLYSGFLIVATGSIGTGAVRVAGFNKWDGNWYLAIGRFGYGPPPPGGQQTRWPFFPFLPGVIRALGELRIPERGGTVVLNQLIFLVALAGLWRLARRHTGARPSQLAVWSLALFPGAFIFSMIYPSSIFLAASVWAFVLVEEHRDLAATAVVAAAALVRPNGIVLAVALVLALRSWRRVLVVCGPAVLAVITWCALSQYWTGDAFVFLDAKAGWPEVTVKSFLLHPEKYDYVFPHLALAFAAILAVVIVRRRLPGSWILFTALYLAPSLGLGLVGLGRYANECFPPFVAAGEILDRMKLRLRIAMFAAAIVGQAICAWWVIHQQYLP